jgi:hypothetical protein
MGVLSDCEQLAGGFDLRSCSRVRQICAGDLGPAWFANNEFGLGLAAG